MVHPDRNYNKIDRMDIDRAFAIIKGYSAPESENERLEAIEYLIDSGHGSIINEYIISNKVLEPAI